MFIFLQILWENVSLVARSLPPHSPLPRTSSPSSSSFFWQSMELRPVVHIYCKDGWKYISFYQGSYNLCLGFWRPHCRATWFGRCLMFKLWTCLPSLYVVDEWHELLWHFLSTFGLEYWCIVIFIPLSDTHIGPLGVQPKNLLPCWHRQTQWAES